MPNSYVEISRTATDATYALPSTFKYLSINDIHVMKIDSSNALTAVPESSISRSGNQITVNGISSSYPTLRFYRATTTTQQVDFVNGARLTEEQLDTAYRQSLYAAQEVTENASGGNASYNVTDIQTNQLSSTFTLNTSKLTGTIGDNQLTSGVGTSANQIVKLDGSAKLPAVDGSQLTNLPTHTAGTLSIGVGQSWTDVTSSRAFSTDYTNNTGKPIMVTFVATTTTGDSVEPRVGGVGLGHVYTNVSSGREMSSFIVPDNTVYQIYANVGSTTPALVKWVELR